ncbi:MAG: hypothetical protein WDZ70_00620 [Candidatus Paceibacterota bacterium]
MSKQTPRLLAGCFVIEEGMLHYLYMQSLSSFTKFLLGFILIIAISLVITSLIPPDNQEAAVEECGVDEIC